MLTLKKHQRLYEIVDRVFDVAMSLEKERSVTSRLQQLAEDANLSITTVRNLYIFKTRYPRAQTVFMLALAVGFDLNINQAKKGTKLRLLA